MRLLVALLLGLARGWKSDRLPIALAGAARTSVAGLAKDDVCLGMETGGKAEIC